MGIGDWGLGIGDWPNPQSPIPNPQSPIKNMIKHKNLNNYSCYFFIEIKNDVSLDNSNL